MFVGHNPALTNLWVAAGPQSIIIWSLPISRAKEDPNLSGVGVGVPAPNMCAVTIYCRPFSSFFHKDIFCNYHRLELRAGVDHLSALLNCKDHSDSAEFDFH